MSDFAREIQRLIYLAAENVPAWSDIAVWLILGALVVLTLLLTPSVSSRTMSADERTDD